MNKYFLSIKRVKFKVIIGCFLYFYIALISPELSYSQSQNDWEQDIEFFGNYIKETHLNAFHSTSEEEFDNALNQLKNEARNLDKVTFNLRLLEIVASIGDMHTNMSFQPSYRLPFKIFLFKEGFFIRAVDPNLRKLLGQQIISINGHPIDEVFEKLKTITSADNEIGYLVNTLNFMEYPEVLAHFGFSSEPGDSIKFTLKDRGDMNISPTLESFEESKMLQVFSEVDKEPALYLKNIYQKRYWKEYLNQENVLYVQVNSIRNNSNQDTFEGFFDEVIQEINSKKPDKVVLDLRWNGGGNDPVYRTSLPKFIAALETNDLNHKNKFFTITGRYTASAAQHLVNDLEYLTQTTFVGEPTKQNVHFFSDSRIAQLPVSGIRVAVSTGWIQNYVPYGIEDRTIFYPDREIPVTFENFQKNIDAALEWILEQ